MTIQAINTYYAGHYFRSRLEARWACVFNDLGLNWEYEPQGYRVGEDRRPYLPDFRLPDIGWWVEVKGTREYLDTSLLADAVHPTKGLGPDGGSTNILILGPIPDTAGRAPLHYSVSRPAVCGQFHRCTADCEFPPVQFGLHWLMAVSDMAHLGADVRQVAAKDLTAMSRFGAMPIPVGRPSAAVPKGDLTKTLMHRAIRPGPHLEAAYTLGRTARFEHDDAYPHTG